MPDSDLERPSSIEDLLQNILSAIRSVDIQDAFYDILNDAYNWLTNSAVQTSGRPERA